ncbi:PAS domain-containing protein [Rhizobium sp. RU20A]|uniref:sensor histidine kinase n=1 Tax=Rhizobium sp. RU20A TaxID=1907412 RepID=UPI000953AC1E|nr:PAS domain-containing sensor histidine kinase [Rhizobium sp. RU20A]SIQ83345.1 PAS domain-containing protein [Rhizobium sp. RU20A]
MASGISKALRRLFFGHLAPVTRRLASGTCLSSLLAADAMAADAATRATMFQSTEIVIFSVLIGVISAAMLSAIWMIRQRGNMETDNRELRAALSDANHQISRFEALISDKNRRIVVWEGQGSRAEFLGQLPIETGAPQENADFLAFGRWVKPQSASELEHAIERLRSSAQSFDIAIETGRGQILEAQGRVSGSQAFVRFVALTNLREELAGLKIERESLHAALTTLRTLCDAIDLPMWQRDREDRLVWVNQAFSDAVEAATPQAAVSEGRELLATVAREKIRAAATYDTPFRGTLSTVVKGNRTFYDVVDARSKNGTAGLALDVSAIEAIREELKRTLKSHAETLDHLATPVAIFDGEQRLQFYNQAFQVLWNLDMGFLERKPTNGEVFERLRAEGQLPELLNWKQWKDNALSVYQAIDTRSDEWHLPNGQTLRAFATARPQGGVTWVFENLTEKVSLETRYNTLLHVQGETIDHLSEGVAVFGADGRITLSNPAFRAIWGVTKEQVEPGTHIKAIEKACAIAYDQPDGWKRFNTIITSFDDERQECKGRLELRTNLILDFAIIPLPNAQTMLTFVNTTDSVRVERALTEKNEALRLADSLKNDFVQHVSYELRSPLTNIIGFAELLKTPAFGTLSERQAEYVDHISTSSSLVLTIVNDILDLATVDAGIVELDYSEIDLADLLEDVGQQVADRLQEGGLTLSIEAPGALGSIIADHGRLKQILLKLLANAANFAPEGSVIRLGCARDGSDFVFRVSDSGPGIPKDVLDVVFDRFESHGAAGGAGLGLSIVQSFVKLHHGTVSIRSEEGRGTEVTCRIPNGPSLHSRFIAAE